MVCLINSIELYNALSVLLNCDYPRMLSVETHSLPLKMIRLLATSAMIVNFVFSAFTILLLLITQLIQVNFSRSCCY